MPTPTLTLSTPKVLPTDRLMGVVDEALENVKRAQAIQHHIAGMMARYAGQVLPHEAANSIMQALAVHAPVTTNLGMAHGYLKANSNKLRSNRETQRKKYIPGYAPPLAPVSYEIPLTPAQQADYDQMMSDKPTAPASKPTFHQGDDVPKPGEDVFNAPQAKADPT